MEHLLLLILHVIGVAIGVGAAFTSDPLFISSIRNRRISSDQLVLLHAQSRVVLGGLTLVILSGIGLVWFHPGHLLDGIFLAKMTIVFVIAADGAVFHLKVLPILEDHVDENLDEALLCEQLPLLSASGATSSVSWFSALILGLLLAVELPYLLLINIYLILVVSASIVAYLVLSLLIFTPQPEPEEVLAHERFERAFGWLPAVLAVVVLGVIAVAIGHATAVA